MKTLYSCCLLLFTLSIGYAQQEKLTTHTLHITPFIDKLENDEQFTLHYSSTGCFHNTKEMITFTKESGMYYVVFQNKRKKLDRLHLEKIRVFEKELAQQTHQGCTTVDNYLLIYHSSQRIISDGSCSWNGYTKLKKELGLS